MKTLSQHINESFSAQERHVNNEAFKFLALQSKKYIDDKFLGVDPLVAKSLYDDYYAQKTFDNAALYAKYEKDLRKTKFTSEHQLSGFIGRLDTFIVSLDQHDVDMSNIKAVGKKLKALVTKKLDPASFFEYIEDYSKNNGANSYKFSISDVAFLYDVYNKIKHYKVASQLNTSQLKADKIYLSYSS